MEVSVPRFLHRKQRKYASNHSNLKSYTGMQSYICEKCMIAADSRPATHGRMSAVTGRQVDKAETNPTLQPPDAEPDRISRKRIWKIAISHFVPLPSLSSLQKMKKFFEMAARGLISTSLRSPGSTYTHLLNGSFLGKFLFEH